MNLSAKLIYFTNLQGAHQSPWVILFLLELTAEIQATHPNSYKIIISPFPSTCPRDLRQVLNGKTSSGVLSRAKTQQSETRLTTRGSMWTSQGPWCRGAGLKGSSCQAASPPPIHSPMLTATVVNSLLLLHRLLRSWRPWTLSVLSTTLSSEPGT